MSELTEDQKSTVAEWVEAGESLSSIQSKIQESFEISMTYMDVRFLVDDLGVELKEKNEEKKSKVESADVEEAVLEPVDDGDASGAASPTDDLLGESQSAGGGGSVSVSVDKVQRPGTVVGGDVTFSDGVTAQWQIDQMGRLGIVPPKEGYQPPEADIAEFQTQLQSILQKQGF